MIATILSFIRWVLMLGGSFLVDRGVLATGDLDTIIPALIALIAAVLEIVARKRQKALPAPEVK